MSAGLVIVGGSYAASQIAVSAREHGYAAPVRILSDEPCLPYQRPPLSKGFLFGKVSEAALPIRGEAFYREAAIEVRLGTRVASIDRARRVVETADGQQFAYGRLALALGTHARHLPVPGADLDRVATLRTLADACRLREQALEGESVVIIGGGFIGLEVASALTLLGKRVTIVEAQERLLARAVAPQLSAFLAEIHARKGVRIRLNMTVRVIEGDRGRACAVVCADGERLDADLVLIAAGAAPNTELARAAGLACDDGIVVDRFARTSDPDIVAAGDCTRHPNAFADAPVRLESVQNALDQAKTAGATVAGVDRPYDAVPWFWSDQYDLKLQMVGLAAGHDQTVVRGSIADGKFSVVYLRGGRLIAVDSVNRPMDHIVGRRLVAARALVTAEQAADASFDLRKLAGAAA